MIKSKPASAGRIFISYRRQDTAYPAGWLYDRLAARYGSEQVFKDVDSIDLGDDFVAILTGAVGSCEVLLALIGPQWLQILDPSGKRRLDDPEDFVRLEIEAALARGVVLIPVLVNGAKLPAVDELPLGLAPVLGRQPLELRSDSFRADADLLLAHIDKIVRPKKPVQRTLIAAGVAVTGMAVAAAILFMPSGEDPPRKLKCWNGDIVAVDANCPPLKGLAAFEWAYRWDVSEFQAPRCDRVNPIDQGVVDEYHCKWDDLRGTNSQVRLQRWPSVKFAKSFIDQLGLAPADPFLISDSGSGRPDDVGWMWTARYKNFEGGGEATAYYFLFRRVPLVLIAIGQDETIELAANNRNALVDRLLGRTDAEISAVIKTIKK